MANEYLVRYLTVGYCFFIFAACTTLLRTYSRACQYRRFGLDDNLIVVATVTIPPTLAEWVRAPTLI